MLEEDRLSLEEETEEKKEKDGRFANWFTKQWQRVNLTYAFIRVPVDIIKLLLWLFIYLELAQWIEMSLENMMFIIATAGFILLFLGWILDRSGIFYKYQSQYDKIQTAEVSVHRWRMAGAYWTKYQRMSEGKDTSVIDAVIAKEKAWFFPMGVPSSVAVEPTIEDL